MLNICPVHDDGTHDCCADCQFRAVVLREFLTKSKAMV